MTSVRGGRRGVGGREKEEGGEGETEKKRKRKKKGERTGILHIHSLIVYSFLFTDRRPRCLQGSLDVCHGNGWCSGHILQTKKNKQREKQSNMLHSAVTSAFFAVVVLLFPSTFSQATSI